MYIFHSDVLTYLPIYEPQYLHISYTAKIKTLDLLH